MGKDSDEHPTLPVGAPAPDFSLKGVDGKTYTLSSFREARVLVIVFTCNHCPTAQAYEDRLIRLTDDYRNKGVAVVAIMPNDPRSVQLSELGYTDMGDSFEEMKRRSAEKHFNFQKPGKIPHTQDTRNAIEALLRGLEPPVATTKVFGCSIKWSEKSDWRIKVREEWASEPVKLDTTDVAGLQALVKNNSDKLRLINVWATWCGPCVTEFPDLVDINRMYRRRDFEFITVSADDPTKKDKALKFLQGEMASAANYIFYIDDKYKIIVDDPATGRYY